MPAKVSTMDFVPASLLKEYGRIIYTVIAILVRCLFSRVVFQKNSDLRKSHLKKSGLNQVDPASYDSPESGTISCCRSRNYTGYLSVNLSISRSYC